MPRVIGNFKHSCGVQNQPMSETFKESQKSEFIENISVCFFSLSERMLEKPSVASVQNFNPELNNNFLSAIYRASEHFNERLVYLISSNETQSLCNKISKCLNTCKNVWIDLGCNLRMSLLLFMNCIYIRE